MGTRGLTCVAVDRELKVAQYGQWDHYPDGVGMGIAEFVEHIVNADIVELFANAVRECRFLTDEEVLEKKKAVPWYKEDSGWITLDVSEKVKKELPELHRDTGAGILQMVLDGTRELQDAHTFAADGVFCEWAYVVDLDKQEILVFMDGFSDWKKDKPFAKVKFKNAVAGMMKVCRKWDKVNE